MTDSSPECMQGCSGLKGLFVVRGNGESSHYVVQMAGELDLASRADAIVACAKADPLDVVVDLSQLAFMDCAGYSALADANAELEKRGGSLSVVNSAGEPHLLLELIAELEPGLARRCRAEHPAV